MTTRRRFEQFDHTADVGIQAFGASPAELFENAALGMFSLIADLKTVQEDRRQDVAVESGSMEALLVEWLRELLFLHEVNDLIFTCFSVKEISATHLRATVRSGPLVRGETETLRQIKAVTYHGLTIEEDTDGWRAKVIFDT